MPASLPSFYQHTNPTTPPPNPQCSGQVGLLSVLHSGPLLPQDLCTCSCHYLEPSSLSYIHWPIRWQHKHHITIPGLLGKTKSYWHRLSSCNCVVVAVTGTLLLMHVICVIRWLMIIVPTEHIVNSRKSSVCLCLCSLLCFQCLANGEALKHLMYEWMNE